MRRSLILLAIFGAACGSETEETPPCPETWVQRADTDCAPPDREIIWNVYASTPENPINLDQSFICQIETTDREARLNAWKQEYGVIARDDECVVVRSLNDSESETGSMRTTPTGTYSIANGVDTLDHPGTQSSCLTTEQPPPDFLAPGATYTLAANGTDAGDFEFDVVLPASTTHQNAPGPDGIEVTWDPFGADRVAIRIGQADPYREVICETDDDGEFTVSEWLIAELQSGGATFRLEGENVDLYELDDGTRVFVRGVTSFEQNIFFQ